MKNLNASAENWESTKTSVFWGEIAPCDHVVQIYEDHDCFLSTLEEFIVSGLLADEGVVIIATDVHLRALRERLQKRGLSADVLAGADQYFQIEARLALDEFMVNNWPDEGLFEAWINSIIKRAKRNRKKVRAFGEMVALLWADGKNGPTVQLEKLWNKLHDKDEFSLYCAYPRTGFTQSPAESLKTICNAHHRVIDGQLSGRSLIYHRANI